MSNLVRHSYHLVDESPWPILSSIAAFTLTVGLSKWFHTNSPLLAGLGLLCLLIIIIQWWRDVVCERTYQGLHSSIVELGMRWGIILFIVSEIFFFLSFFWAFFHSRLAPRIFIGGIWPPHGILVFDALEVPFLNTLILLSSGVRVTWRHHRLISGIHKEAFWGLIITVLLGIYFTALQALEYYEASFRIADSVYRSTFYIATGFHGLHVIVGTIFLIVSLYRIKKCHFRRTHHFGFEAAAWYWHFVDVVWLFLYLVIYWWGGFDYLTT